MPRKGNIIPKAPLERILKANGAKRVSDGAAEIMSTHLQTICEKICSQSIKIAKHSGRRTVLDSDIRLANKS